MRSYGHKTQSKKEQKIKNKLLNGSNVDGDMVGNSVGLIVGNRVGIVVGNLVLTNSNKENERQICQFSTKIKARAGKGKYKIN